MRFSLYFRKVGWGLKSDEREKTLYVKAMQIVHIKL